MGKASRRKREQTRDERVAARAPRLVAQTELKDLDLDKEVARFRKRGDIVYDRVCTKCGERTIGAIGGDMPLRISREEAERILATHGRFVCSKCDPSDKQRWMTEVAGKLGFM